MSCLAKRKRKWGSFYQPPLIIDNLQFTLLSVCLMMTEIFVKSDCFYQALYSIQRYHLAIVIKYECIIRLQTPAFYFSHKSLCHQDVSADPDQSGSLAAPCIHLWLLSSEHFLDNLDLVGPRQSQLCDFSLIPLQDNL